MLIMIIMSLPQLKQPWFLCVEIAKKRLLRKKSINILKFHVFLNVYGLWVMDAYLHKYCAVANDNSFNTIIIIDVLIGICHQIVDI